MDTQTNGPDPAKEGEPTVSGRISGIVARIFLLLLLGFILVKFIIHYVM